MERKLTRKIMVGGVPVGGGAPVSIQSMLNTRTTDVDGCLAQIRALAAAGCEIARLAVPDMIITKSARSAARLPNSRTRNCSTLLRIPG